MSVNISKAINVRNISKERLSSFRYVYPVDGEPRTDYGTRLSGAENELAIFLACAGYKIHWIKFLAVTLVFGATLFLVGLFVNKYLSVVFLVVGVSLPIYFAKREAIKRANMFAEEYPSVLLAMASNMKAGLTVYASLERSIMLLSENSIVRKEVKLFLENVSRGVSTERAVANFGKNIDLKELELFRRAFSLVVVHGGRFSRTLERLAQVCRDRENLIKSSKVSTASMRMTSNVLLVVAPGLIFVLSLRNKDFWNTFFNNSTAFTLGVIGLLTIVVSVASLRKMSDFKP